MKKTFFLFLLVPVILIALFIENANTQTDPGLIKWMQDQDRQIQSNRQMINHEQKQRFELESRLIKMMQNDIKNVRQHINNLQFEIREMQNRLNKHEDNIRNLAQ
jgi:peptidoglycan hydrolase CwlO-like protein